MQSIGTQKPIVWILRIIQGNVLYANGFRLRELTSAEQQELVSYQKEISDYKTVGLQGN